MGKNANGTTEQTTEQTTTEQTTPEQQTPQKVETKTEKATPQKVEIKTEPEKAETTTKRARLGADDDDIPEEAELLELSSSALKKRLSRHTSKELKEKFGTADFGEIKKRLDRAAELEAAEEERTRAAMTERERLESDLKKERQLRADAERRATRVHEERIIEKEEGRIGRIASKYIDEDPDVQEIVYKRFSKHLRSDYTDEQLKALTDKDIQKWFKKYADEHPKHARTGGGEEPRKVPLNNGPKTENRPPPENKSGQNLAQNYSPKGPNPMSRQEAKANAAKEGYTW